MPTVTATGACWREWSTEAFQAARRASRPVLLLVTASWSAACRRLERDMLADGEVAGRLAADFVAVRVDADRRPDIADRYGLGGWPTLACLTPDGEVLSGGTAIAIERLAQSLADVARAFADRRDDIEHRARQSRRLRRTGGPASPAAASEDSGGPTEVAAELRAAFDGTWAGFGDGPKVPSAPPVAFALAHGTRAGDRDLVDLAVRTLDRIGWGDLSDAASGAFHRACTNRDWTAPDTARLLDVQAELAALFLDAAVALDEQAYAARARAALDYVTRTLADEMGGFFNSEAASGGDDDRGERVDRLIVTSANARMVRTLLRAADVLEEPRLAEAAMDAIERIVPVAYAPGAGVAHCLVQGSPRVRGLLADQVHMSAALVDLSQASGNRVYAELAEELMRSCRRKLWSPEHGGFLDRLRTTSGGGDIGLLADPLVPPAANCEAARVLARLARETGHEDLHDMARETLAAIGAACRDRLTDACDFALAAGEVGA